LIDHLIMGVVNTLLLAIRLAAVLLGTKAYSYNTLYLPKTIIETGTPITQTHTLTVVHVLALVRYHRRFNTVVDLVLLSLASLATRHRFVNPLAPLNPAASLLSVVPLATTIVAILVIQNRSKDGTDVLLRLPITENGRETIGDHDTAANICNMVLHSRRSIHPGLLGHTALENHLLEEFTRQGTGKASPQVLLPSILVSAPRLHRLPSSRPCIMNRRD
jgi:hypothetical protein